MMFIHRFRLIGFPIAASLIVLGFVSAWSQENSSTSYSTSSKTTTIRHSNGLSNFNVEMRGKLEITDDDKDIKSMSPDGYLEITKTVFGSKRTLIISPQGTGLKREYYEGRTQLPYEPEGRKWLGEILPELLRTTTIAAESRVKRFYSQGGATAVLKEIEAMESDHVKQHYATLLMQVPGLAPKEYATIIKRITATLDSDHYLTQFLRKDISRFMSTKESTDAVFLASRKMDSDHYKTEVIKEALRIQTPSLESVKILLAAATEMDSDHYKTEVLVALMKQSNLPDEVISEMIKTSRSLDSDHYRTVVLKKALGYKDLSATSYQRVLESVMDFDSDHYKTEVLTNLLSRKLAASEIFTIVDLSKSIDSDHYLTVVFTEVLKKQDLNDEAFNSLMDRASHLSSDHYASTILKNALDLPQLSNPKMISILTAAGNIKSDHYIATVLVDAAPLVKGNSAQLRDAYMKVAKHISSDTYYGQAMRALD